MKVAIPDSIDGTLAEEVGMHIGDGSMGVYRGRYLYSLAGHRKDDRQYYHELVLPLFKKLYKCEPKLRFWSGSMGFQICSKELVNFKASLGLPLGPKLGIRIPTDISHTENLAKACLRGILDTDGTMYLEKKNEKLYPRIQLKTCSNLLVEDVTNILGKLGYNHSCYAEKPASKDRRVCYAIALRGYIVERWMAEVGSDNPKHLRKYDKYIKSVSR